MPNYPNFENQTERKRQFDDPYYCEVKERKGFKITQAELEKAPGYIKPIGSHYKNAYF